jgi:L,D-transpeptidase YcbB
VELNPYWTVPPGIVGEVLANAGRDGDYLERERMRVLDHAGRALRADDIDFSRYTARSFPWTFRQEPGPRNPLGSIKIMFPNRHNVYLHDTPSRQLFAREERLFSHGCIRVEHPVELAALMLDDAAWSADALRVGIAAGATRAIPLRRPVTVLVQYWTAGADRHGELHLYRDVYGRDAALLDALLRR